MGAQVGMAFWLHDTEDSWHEAPGDVYAKLPIREVDGLISACKNGGFSAVWLFVYSHQHIQNLPGGVRQRSAAEYLSWEAALTMHQHGAPVGTALRALNPGLSKAACPPGGAFPVRPLRGASPARRVP